MGDARSDHYQNQRTIKPAGLLLCFIGLVAVAVTITQRVVSTSIPTDHLALLHITPQLLAQLDATSQYSLIATLVLAGLIVDIIGPRTMLIVAIIVTIIADYISDTPDSIQALFISKILINNSLLFILTSVLTLGSYWLPRRHFSIFVGLVFGVFLLGPVILKAPIAALISENRLININMHLTVISLIIIFCIAITEPVHDQVRRRLNNRPVYAHFRPLFNYKIWLCGLIAMIGWMTNTFFLSTGIYYLTWQIHFSFQQAMDAIDTVFICFAAGTIIMGIVSDFFERKRNLIAISYCLAAAAFSVVIFIPGISVTAVTWLLCATAFFASSNIICYPKANDYCTAENTGITLGLLLSISTIGSNLFSKSMHYFVKNYIYVDPKVSICNWEMIVIIIPILLLLGSLIALVFLKPKEIRHFDPRADSRNST